MHGVEGTNGWGGKSSLAEAWQSKPRHEKTQKQGMGFTAKQLAGNSIDVFLIRESALHTAFT